METTGILHELKNLAVNSVRAVSNTVGAAADIIEGGGKFAKASLNAGANIVKGAGVAGRGALEGFGIASKGIGEGVGLDNVLSLTPHNNYTSS